MDDLKIFLTVFGTNAYIQALAVLLVALVLAKVTDWFLTRVLTRLTRRTDNDIDDQLVGMLHKPVFYSVLLAGLAVALVLIAPPAPFGTMGQGFIRTLTIFLWLFTGVRAVLLLLDWMSSHQQRFHVVQPTTKPLFDIGARVVLFGSAIYFMFISWGIDVTAWLASAGILGIAVGFAAKDTLANLFAGVFILADAPYKVGDVIVLDGGERGRVSDIGIRSTRIITRDDIEITVPNSAIANSKIVNESGGTHVKYRNRLPLGVAYGTDIDRLRRVLMGVAEEAVKNGDICAQPEPRVRFRAFGDSSLDLELLFWIEDSYFRGAAIDLMNTSVYKALNEAGIEIPFPQRDVHVKQIPGAMPSNSS